MKFTRRAIAVSTLAAALLPLPLLAQQAAENVRLIVPFAPGGAVDQTARAISLALGRELGANIVIDNKAGASGSLGAIELAKAKPDGKTLALALDSQAVNHLLIKNLPFDTFKSFDYLSMLVTTPQVLVVRNDIPAKNLAELVDYLRKTPGTPYGSAGTASAGHVNSAQLSLARDLQTTHIPYKGASPLLADLLGGHISFAFAGLSVMLPHIQGGKMRAIAVSSPQRSEKLPDVPAMKEMIPGFDYPTWIGITAPAGMPADVRQKVISAVNATMKDPDVVARLKASAFDIVNTTPEVFASRVQKDADVMADLVKRKIISAD